NRSLWDELGRVRERGRDDLGVRVRELRDRVQREFKLTQLSRRFRAKYFDLAFLACSDRSQLVALALAFITCRQRVLDRRLHADFSPHECALLIGRLLRLFRIDALLLRRTFLDKSLGKLCGELLAAHGNQKLRWNCWLAEPHFADGDTGLLRLR